MLNRNRNIVKKYVTFKWKGFTLSQQYDLIWSYSVVTLHLLFDHNKYGTTTI